MTMLTVISSDQISEKTPIPPPDWEALIEVIAKDMIDERSPARILQVRAKLYDLLTHCIPATTILKVCLRTLPQPERQFG
jgi:replication factor C subunit 3/5